MHTNFVHILYALYTALHVSFTFAPTSISADSPTPGWPYMVTSETHNHLCTDRPHTLIVTVGELR